MNPAEHHYLLFGKGSEYVLSPIAERLQQERLQVTEIDLNRTNDPWASISSLTAPIVFITSAHLVTGTAISPDSDPSPLQLLRKLQPVRSIYVAHDLADPFHEEELPWLPLFDLFVSPRTGMEYLNAYTQVAECGWIRKRGILPGIPRAKMHNISIGFAFSELIYHQKLGIEKTLALWLPLLHQVSSVKFPAWPGVEIFEKAFRDVGINVLPAESDTMRFISEHHIMITNGLSSVAFEAALSGRRVFNVIDGSHPESEHLKTFRSLDSLKFGSIEKVAEQLKDIREAPDFISCGEDRLQPFDMDYFLRLIFEEHPAK